MSVIPEFRRKSEKRPLSINAMAATGSPIACLIMLVVSALPHRDKRVVQRCQLIRPLGLFPVLELVEDVLVYKGFFGNGVAHDIAYAKNGPSIVLSRQNRAYLRN